jgi:hypothetical protein
LKNTIIAQWARAMHDLLVATPSPTVEEINELLQAFGLPVEEM